MESRINFQSSCFLLLLLLCFFVVFFELQNIFHIRIVSSHRSRTKEGKLRKWVEQQQQVLTRKSSIKFVNKSNHLKKEKLFPSNNLQLPLLLIFYFLSSLSINSNEEEKSSIIKFSKLQSQTFELYINIQGPFNI